MKSLSTNLIQKIFGYLSETTYQENLKIAVALSGGSDSMALAHVLAVSHKAVFPDANLCFIHINHGWRGEESDNDQKFVESFAKEHNIPCHSYFKPSVDKTISAEKEASDARKEVFKLFTDQGYTIFTAHTANDVLETMLWRLCDDKMDTHDKGILIQTLDGQFRPFLTTTKDELEEYLTSVGQTWRVDKTNLDGKLMRSKLRLNVVPELLKVYPQALRKVSQAAVRKQKRKV